MKYIQSTPTHGVVHIFIGKSIIRRIFWLLIVLVAASYCLYNISDRIRYLSSNPTSTTTSLVQHESLEFPAITICNLNSVKRSYLETVNASALTNFISNLTAECDFSNIDTSVEGLNLSQVLLEGRHKAEDFILSCYFMGQSCEEKFIQVVTRLGVCYSFNSDPTNISSSRVTGPRFGLQVILNVEQEEYTNTINGDAGVILVVHSQHEPGEPTDAGITIPPGHAARVGLTKKIVRDLSHTDCRKSDSADFNFLPDMYNRYSLSACLVDSYFTDVAEKCGCIETSVMARPTSGRYASLPDCGVKDLCCSLKLFDTVPTSSCLSACNHASFPTTISYSSFPAEYFTDYLSAMTNISRDRFQKNLLSVSVFFQDFAVEEQVTRRVYGASALLSDIGGQLGLFLGASVVSILEFFLWVLDETKDRCVGVNDRKLGRWLRRRVLQCQRLEREVEVQLEEMGVTHTKSKDNKLNSS